MDYVSPGRQMRRAGNRAEIMVRVSQQTSNYLVTYRIFSCFFHKKYSVKGTYTPQGGNTELSPGFLPVHRG